MKKQIEAIIAKLEALCEKASERANSENEKTSERYVDIPSAIETAIDALQEAVDALT